jgi:S1-C subfamily serine protease
MRGLLRVLAILVVTTIPGGPAGADRSPESVFRDARLYTVRIRTQITSPFLEDERGSFSGSGFLIDAGRRWVVTNAHVVGQSPSQVHASFIDGTYRPARKVYVDSFTDVAVLEVANDGVVRPVAALDCVNPPAIGEGVGAFGHPLDIPFTGTRGIVSGVTNQFGEDLIQIDATVDHGNSGGPVIALRTGRVVGIATAGAGGAKSDRVNFTTPMRDVCRILELLRRGVSPEPPRIEFDLLVDDDGRHTLEVAGTKDPGRWPFEPGDRIVTVGEERQIVRTLTELVTSLRGRTGMVPLQVRRGDRVVEIPTRPRPRSPVIARRGLRIDGALIAAASFDDSTVLREPARLVVQSVDEGSPAEALGIEQYDILQTVNGRSPDDLDALVALLRGRPEGTPLRVVLRRLTDGSRLLVTHVRELPGEEIEMIGPKEPLMGSR